MKDTGVCTVTGAITRAAPVEIECTNGGPATIAEFKTGGGVMASIAASGLGDFSLNGVQTEVVTSDPNTSRSGTRGEVVIWYSAGVATICVNTTSGSGSSTSWAHFTLS